MSTRRSRSMRDTTARGPPPDRRPDGARLDDSASSSDWLPRSGLWISSAPSGAAWLRLTWAGLLFLVIVRPRRQHFTGPACWPPWPSASPRRESRCASWPRSTGCPSAPRARWSSSARSGGDRPGARPRARLWPAGGGRRHRAVDGAVARGGGPGRRRLRPRRRVLLGGVHRAHPARRRRGHRANGLAISMPVAALISTAVAGPSLSRR